MTRQFFFSNAKIKDGSFSCEMCDRLIIKNSKFMNNRNSLNGAAIYIYDEINTNKDSGFSWLENIIIQHLKTEVQSLFITKI